MTTNSRVWAYSLPATLLLMAPFDILASLAMDIYLPAVPTMPGILNTSPAIIQLTLSLYMIMLGVGQIVFGPISDRIGRRPVLIGGALLFSAASFGLAASSTATSFVVFRLLQATGASAALVAMFATVRDVYADRAESVSIYGLFSALLAFVPAVGPIAGAVIADRLGWRAIFAVLGIAAVAALVNAVFRWHETRPESAATSSGRPILPLFQSSAFWTYTLGFSAAMGTFFVFFSTAPRMLIGRGELSELTFSLMFATVALAMIISTRLAGQFVAKWGVPGSLARGMSILLAGAVLLTVGQIFGSASFLTLIVPMWVMAIGIILVVSVTANGALEGFDDIAGSAVAFYFCIQSLITGSLGTLVVVMFDGDTAWPLVAYSGFMALVVLGALALLRFQKTPV